MLYRPGNTGAGRPFHSERHCAWKEVPAKPHSSGVPRIQMMWMVLEFVAYCAVSKFEPALKNPCALDSVST